MIRNLLRNSFSNVAIVFLKMAVAFIMSPLIVHALGNYDYGIWEIVFSIVGYMGLLEFGLQPALVQNVSRYSALGDKTSLNKIYSTSLFFMGSVGLLVALLLIGWALIAPDLLSKSEGDVTKYSFFLIIVAAQVFVTFVGNVFLSFQHGFQRYHFTNLIIAANTIVGAAILYYFLKHGHGLITLALINTIGVAIKFCIFGVFLKFNDLDSFRFKYQGVSLEMLKDLFSFGLKSFVLGISSRISNSTDSLVIGIILTPVIVTFYIIPVNIVRHARNLLINLTLNFMPFFSDLFAKNEKEIAKSVFLIASRYIAGITVLLGIGIYILGFPFLARWMGLDYAEKGYLVLYIITLGYLLPQLNPFHGRLLTSVNRHGILAKIRPAQAIANLILSIFLIKIFGKEGVAVGTLIPVLIVEPVILVVVCRYLEISVMGYLKTVILPLIPPAVITIGIYSVFLPVPKEALSYSEILINAGMIASLYSALFFIFSVNRRERSFFFSKLRQKHSA